METVYTKHQEQLAASLEPGDLAIVFAGEAPKSSADAQYRFLTNKNFFYLTGCRQQRFVAAFLKTEHAFKATLFIEKPDYDIEKWVGRKLTKDQAIMLSGIEDVQYLSEFNTWVARTVYAGSVKRLFLDLEKLSWDEPDSVAAQYAHAFSGRYPFVKLESLHPLMVNLRMLKGTQEIEEMRRAIALTHKGLDAILKVLNPGVYEYQLEATFEHAIRMGGADGCSFETIAASGDDGVILHYVENKKVLEANRLVLMDLGAQYGEYAADISRTYPVSGTYSPRQREIYEIVLNAQKTVIEAMKPGTPFESLNKLCQSFLTGELKRIGLIEDDSELGNYYYHGVSHHLGLNVHDISDRGRTLEPGMVLTVEPGLYIAEEGIGIRIEDDILITETGCEVLSAEIPKEIDDIERFLKLR